MTAVAGSPLAGPCFVAKRRSHDTMLGVDRPSSLATLSFSCLGHLYVHLFTAFYFVIVLALEESWGVPYHELIELWTLGALLVGLAALPAGILSDRVGAPAMMVALFLGMGACSVAAAWSDSTGHLLIWLTGIGLFAAIYHPVGIPWLVRSAKSARGKALGFNGIFGSMGAAVAALATGALIQAAGWPAAFLVPGGISLATGVALLVFIWRGRIHDSLERPPGEEPGPAGKLRVFAILLVTMFLAGLVYSATQTVLPKIFSERANEITAGGTFGVGALVAAVYGVAGVLQIVGGHLADRFPLKVVYLGALVIQAPLLWLVAGLGGSALIVVATLMVVSNVGALPAENMILVRYAPPGRHGLAFGLKFVVAFGATPVAVQLVSLITGSTGGFLWVFRLLAVCILCAFSAALFLPGRLREKPARAAFGQETTARVHFQSGGLAGEE